MSTVPTLAKEDWEEFQQFFLLALMQDPNRKMGRMFVSWFPEVAEAMAENSNLGTPAGVYNPNNDVILYNMQSNVEAKAFITDLVEIV
jgi:hypothetical protein